MTLTKFPKTPTMSFDGLPEMQHLLNYVKENEAALANLRNLCEAIFHWPKPNEYYKGRQDLAREILEALP